jgi:hypothetical protein
MEKNTKILLGVAAAGVVAYLVFKGKKPKSPVIPATKDCVTRNYNCDISWDETIQIPMDADCKNYQPAKPQCAPKPNISEGEPLPNFKLDDFIIYN